MHKLALLLLCVVIIIFFVPKKTFAHGGFEKSAGNVTFEILQDPLSPLVGEKVNMYFKIVDKSVESKNVSDQNLSNQKVTITISDTYPGDESKDKEIFKKDFKTDENGNLSFDYTFNKENYFDIDLTTKDKVGKEESEGFLIRPRNAYPQNVIIIASLVTFIFGILFSSIFLRNKINGKQ